MTDDSFLRGLENTGLGDVAAASLRDVPSPADPFSVQTGPPGGIADPGVDAGLGSPDQAGAPPAQGEPVPGVETFFRSQGTATDSVDRSFGARPTVPLGEDPPLGAQPTPADAGDPSFGAHPASTESGDPSFGAHPASTESGDRSFGAGPTADAGTGGLFGDGTMSDDLADLIGQAGDPTGAAPEGALPARTPAAAAPDDAESAGGRTTRPIDPMVEFHDVFQDIRRAEKGDDLDGTARYLDAGLLGTALEGQSAEAMAKHEAMVRREREERRRRRSEGELDLRGGLGHSLTSRAPGRPRAEESDLIAAALDEAGLREPSEEHIAARAAAEPGVAETALPKSKPQAGPPAYPPMVFPDPAETGGRLAAGLLVIVLTLIAALAYVAFQNDGLLDFREFDQMVGVAFHGEEYQPRHESIVRVVETAEGWVEEVVDSLPTEDDGDLRLAGVVSGVYRSTDGRDFVVVDGVVVNQGDSRYRRVDVVVELVTGDGELAARRIVPAGNGVAQPILEALTDEASLDAAYSSLRDTAADLVVESGQQTPFSGVFLAEDPALAELDDLRFSVGVHSAERETASCWMSVSATSETAPVEAVGSDDPRAAGDERPD